MSPKSGSQRTREIPSVDRAAANEERLARLAWGVAHPIRVKILRILAQRQACICGEIVDELPVAQSTASQHLKILKECGLVQGEVDGPRVCYCLNPLAMKELKSLLGTL
jgi:ArsR family transcriptional regulator, arsenate/arsenite/antimonite-responsive transcriptional repressor